MTDQPASGEEAVSESVEDLHKRIAEIQELSDLRFRDLQKYTYELESLVELAEALSNIRDHQGLLISGEKRMSATYRIAEDALAKVPVEM